MFSQKKFTSEEKDTCKNIFALLPEPVRLHILSFLTKREVNVCANVSTFFYRDKYRLLESHPTAWIKPIIDLGYSEELIVETLTSGCIKDCRNLYRVLSHLHEEFKIDIKNPWHLLCVSGEPSAIKLGISKGFITDNEMDPEKDYVWGYAVLSGVPAQIDFLLELKVPLGDQVTPRESILHYAVASGSREQILRVLRLEKELNIVISRLAKKERHLLHTAVLSNFPDQVTAVMEIFNVSLESVKNKLGETPIMLAKRVVKNPEMLELIESKRAQNIVNARQVP